VLCINCEKSFSLVGLMHGCFKQVKTDKKEKDTRPVRSVPNPNALSLTLTASGKKSRSMRRPPLQFLAAASTDVSSITTMSSRPPVLSLSLSLSLFIYAHRLHALQFCQTYISSLQYQGGRWRGFSDRPYEGGRGQRGQFVTGDSHFRSVRDANLGFRRGDSGSVADQTGGFRPPPLNTGPPHYAQNAQFRQPPRFNKSKSNNNNNNNTNTNQSQQNRPNRPFDSNPGVRLPQQLRPKPLDYRNWEYGTEVPPPNSGN
jgi:hypothetical protein